MVNIVTGFGETAGAALAAHPGRRQGRVHRLDRGRQADRPGGGRQPEAGLAGARRQVAEHRLRRRRPRRGDRRGASSASSSTTASAAAPARACIVDREGLRRGGRGRRRRRRKKIKLGAGARPGRPRWARWSRRSSSSASPATSSRACEEGAKVRDRRQAAAATAATSSSRRCFTDTKPTMKVVQEEIFGPVVCADAVQRRSRRGSPTQANDTITAWPPRLDAATSARRTGWPRGLRAGTVWINCYNVFDAAAAVRRLQAVRLGPRDGRRGAGELHRDQGRDGQALNAFQSTEIDERLRAARDALEFLARFGS